MRLLCTLLILCIYSFTFSQEKPFFDYLTEQNIQKIRIETDFQYLTSNKYQDTTLKGHVYWTDLSGEQKIDTKISLRGKYRRRVCSFPPIKLNFSKKDLKKYDINSDFDKYKLVTHCDTQTIYENYVNREYLIYQIFQEMTAKSLKVYPLTIEYVFDGSDTKIVKNGFLIENEKELAHRLNLEYFEGMLAPGQGPQIDPYQGYFVSLFLLMVANDDYNFNTHKNICLLKGSDIVPIPYDFDFSGFVNAHYAIPNPNLPAHGIRDRVITYKYEDERLLNEVIDHFVSKSEAIEALIEGSQVLDKSAKKDLNKFISRFLRYIDKNRELPYNEVLSF